MKLSHSWEKRDDPNSVHNDFIQCKRYKGTAIPTS